ncbi:MAG: hypothetical protein H7Y32_02945 [Chloroflexales bacterium]|nr:hypothetical protein [Chloroflexales bacterium]
MRQRNTNSLIRDLATLGAIAAAGYAFRSFASGRRAPATQAIPAGRAVSIAPNTSFDEGAGSTAIGLDSAPVESRTLPNTKFAPENDQPY